MNQYTRDCWYIQWLVNASKPLFTNWCCSCVTTWSTLRRRRAFSVSIKCRYGFDGKASQPLRWWRLHRCHGRVVTAVHELTSTVNWSSPWFPRSYELCNSEW